MDFSPPGSSVHRILQARILEIKSVSHSVMSDSVTPWTVAHQAPLSMEFSRQENWGELPFPSPADIPDPGVKPTSPTLQAESLLMSHWRGPNIEIIYLKIEWYVER